MNESADRMSSSMPPLTLFEIMALKDHDAHITFFVGKSFVANRREELPPHPFRLPFNWNADPFNDRKGIFQDRDATLAEVPFFRQERSRASISIKVCSSEPWYLRQN